MEFRQKLEITDQVRESQLWKVLYYALKQMHLAYGNDLFLKVYPGDEFMAKACDQLYESMLPYEFIREDVDQAVKSLHRHFVSSTPMYYKPSLSTFMSLVKVVYNARVFDEKARVARERKLDNEADAKLMAHLETKAVAFDPLDDPAVQANLATNPEYYKIIGNPDYGKVYVVTEGEDETKLKLVIDNKTLPITINWREEKARVNNPTYWLRQQLNLSKAAPVFDQAWRAGVKKKIIQAAKVKQFKSKQALWMKEQKTNG